MPTTLRWHRGLLPIALACLGGACSPVAPAPAGLDDSRVVVAIRVIRADPQHMDASVPASAEGAAPASAKTPENADSAGERGDVYARAGYLPEAIVEYERSVDLAPNDAARRFKLGLAYQSLRRFDEALAAYQAAARLEPESAWAHTAIAIVQAKMGDQEGAFASYRTVKRLDVKLAEDLLPILMQYGDMRDV